ncbi:MAG: hypothetical protein M1818_006160 [Claussenomyces sp. TS43310]|nr:MAG: hypothetical protein M1818_006160 [Claussenomyces sp. TS43310]
MPRPGDEEEADTPPSTAWTRRHLLHPDPVEVHDYVGDSIFCATPFFGPLLFDNSDSDCRDHCANERTFLSYLRLSIYLSVVSVAIVISFHLKHQPSKLELRMALPLGLVFWALAVACLALGFGNYVKTVTKYSRRMALVQTGWKTQVVGYSSYF